MAAPFRIGLLGLGNVGSALARRLTEDGERVGQAAGRPVRLEAIAVANPAGRKAPAPLVDAEAILDRRDLDAIVEVIGGFEPAHTYINKALSDGRQVITANKQLIATHGPALARLGPLWFEAAVASAIPIIETLTETLAADHIRSIQGILNGTTNSMLETMAAGVSYDEALADAQRRGLAETEPSADVDGHDPAAKLAILAMLAFRRRVDPSTIDRSGIRGFDQARLIEATRRGCVIKLIAAARMSDTESVEADVRPRLIRADAPMARVSGPMNVIEVECAYAGALVLSGLGAGPDAAASAVITDLIRAARGVPASAGAVLASLAESPAVTVRPLGVATPYPAAS